MSRRTRLPLHPLLPQHQPLQQRLRRTMTWPWTKMMTLRQRWPCLWRVAVLPPLQAPVAPVPVRRMSPMSRWCVKRVAALCVVRHSLTWGVRGVLVESQEEDDDLLGSGIPAEFRGLYVLLP